MGLSPLALLKGMSHAQGVSGVDVEGFTGPRRADDRLRQNTTLAVSLLGDESGGKGSPETSQLGNHMKPSFIMQVQENSQGIRSASSIVPPEVFCRMPALCRGECTGLFSILGRQISIVRLGSTSGL